MRSVSRITGTTTPTSGATTEIRRTSDRICKEHGLSVIVPGRDKGKSYIEHQAEQNGTSYKAKLRAAIDRLLPGCVRPGGSAPPPSAGRVRTETGQVYLRQGSGPGAVHEALAARSTGRLSPSRQPNQRTGKPSLLIDI